MPPSHFAGFEMPVGFDVASYDKVHEQFQLIVNPKDLDTLKKNARSSYIYAWKGLAYRLRSSVEYDREFRNLISLGSAPPLEERYSQERALFGCIVSSVSAIDCFYMATYSIAAVLCPSYFPLSKAKELRKYPHDVSEAYKKWLPSDSFSQLLLQVTKSSEYSRLKDLRNVLSHRAVLPRNIQLTTTVDDKPSTIPSNPKDLAENFEYTLSLNDETTSIHTRWVCQITSQLVGALSGFLGCSHKERREMNESELIKRLINEANFHESIATAFIRARCRCEYCGRDMLRGRFGYANSHLDHLLPKSKHDLNIAEHPQNWALGCSMCNSAKNEFDAIEGNEDPLDMLVNHRTALISRARANIREKMKRYDQDWVKALEILLPIWLDSDTGT